jgi:hypothetical protein
MEGWLVIIKFRGITSGCWYLQLILPELHFDFLRSAFKKKGRILKELRNLLLDPERIKPMVETLKLIIPQQRDTYSKSPLPCTFMGHRTGVG